MSAESFKASTESSVAIERKEGIDKEESELIMFRELKKNAPEEVDRLIGDIPGFAKMDTSDQIAALEVELQRLKDEKEEDSDEIKNSNRFIFAEVFRRNEVLKVIEKYQDDMAKLGEKV